MGLDRGLPISYFNELLIVRLFFRNCINNQINIKVLSQQVKYEISKTTLNKKNRDIKGEQTFR